MVDAGINTDVSGFFYAASPVIQLHGNIAFTAIIYRKHRIHRLVHGMVLRHMKIIIHQKNTVKDLIKNHIALASLIFKSYDNAFICLCQDTVFTKFSEIMNFFPQCAGHLVRILF